MKFDFEVKTKTEIETKKINLVRLREKQIASEQLIQEVKNIAGDMGWCIKVMRIEDTESNNEWHKVKEYKRQYVAELIDFDVVPFLTGFKEVTIIYKPKES